jgi:hypothetical protein
VERSRCSPGRADIYPDLLKFLENVPIKFALKFSEGEPIIREWLIYPRMRISTWMAARHPQFDAGFAGRGGFDRFDCFDRFDR